MKKISKILALSCIAVVIALGVFSFTRHISSASSDVDADVQKLFAGPRPVRLEEVSSPTERTQSRSFPGTIEASREALLSFRVSGPIVNINVQPGDLVRKGQVLMEIDPRDYRDSIRVMKAQLDGSLATLENARLDYERAKPLLVEQVISQASYDRTKSTYDTAVSSVKNLKARLQIARHQMEDTQLRAPFDGIISTKTIENHEMVSAGQTVMSVLDISHLEIETNFPEDEIARRSLSIGMKADVEFAPLPGKSFAARLKEWSSAPDPSTRTYKVTFAFPAPTEALILPGMTGELSWHRDTGGGISVPVSAIVSDGKGGSGVWIYDPETSSPSLRTVSTGELAGKDRVIVTEGLESGEQIVIGGAAFVTKDMKLKPIKQAESN